MLLHVPNIRLAEQTGHTDQEEHSDSNLLSVFLSQYVHQSWRKFRLGPCTRTNKLEKGNVFPWLEHRQGILKLTVLLVLR